MDNKLSGLTWPYVLRRGHSSDPSQGACAMDAVNWLVHGKHGDEPECACPIIGAFVIAGNDAMPDNERQKLLEYLPRIAGSRSSEHELARIKAILSQLKSHIVYDGGSIARDLDACTRGRISGILDTGFQAMVQMHNSNGAILMDTVIWAIHEVFGELADSLTGDPLPSSWGLFFEALDVALSAGPQGEPWSADAIEAGAKAFAEAGGMAELVSG